MLYNNCVTFQLADCGLLTSYAVQLQTAIGDLELLTRFRTLIYQFIKDLQVSSKYLYTYACDFSLSC